MADTESSEALQQRNPRLQHERQQKDSEGHDENEEEEEGEQRVEEEKKGVVEPPVAKLQTGKLLSSERRQETDTGGSNLETLAVPSSLESGGKDQFAVLQGSCATRMASETESKDPLVSSDKEIITRETVGAAQSGTQNENQFQVSSRPTSFSEVSPTSVSQSLSSTPATVPEQRLLASKVNNLHVPEVDKKNHSGGKTLSAISVARTPASDGYNWRKYGQKQVKSPTGSRSYYRCTHSACCAKKIECCDDSGHVIEIVYRSQHSHDPPRKTNSSRENKSLSSNEPAVQNSVPEQHMSVRNDSDPSSSSKGLQQEALATAEKKQQNSCDLSQNGKVTLKEDHNNEPQAKKRMKKGDLTYPGSPVKPGKKPKFVVHAAGDVGISGDGYRWRKYGQKMVKGNPHPRNYYRCTSAGCPVRKHIETAVDNSNAVIITYKGVHDHDMPVPKKRHGLPSAPLMAAAAPASMNNSQFKKSDSLQKQKTSTQWSVDTEGELTGEALELGGEKAIESARTLLSIGFEIKPC